MPRAMEICVCRFVSAVRACMGSVRVHLCGHRSTDRDKLGILNPRASGKRLGSAGHSIPGGAHELGGHLHDVVSQRPEAALVGGRQDRRRGVVLVRGETVPSPLAPRLVFSRS